MESSEELVVAWFPLAGDRGGCTQGTYNAKQTMITIPLQQYSTELWTRIHWILIRSSISSESGSGSVSNPDPGVWWPQTEEKKIQLKIFLTFFLIKNCNLLMPKLQEKPSALKREHLALQKWNLWTFSYVCGSFLPSWIRIRIANPDPWTQLNPDPIRIQSGSGSTTLGPDPDVSKNVADQEHCFILGSRIRMDLCSGVQI
jgi:hypothetical protein